MLVRCCLPSFCLLLAVSLMGCGGGPKLPKPVDISGTVTLKGKPLDGATLGFTAIGTGLPAKNRYVSAVTNEAGKYEAKNVLPSEYMVTVNKPTEATNAEMPSANPNSKELAKYSGNSELRATISESATTHNFDLK